MDGNGRWAAARGLTRSAGHKAGLAPVRMCIEECARRGIEALTLFAFSSENWSRPLDEVASLMDLFVDALDREIAELHAKGVRVRFIGARRNLSVRLQARIAAAEERTGGQRAPEAAAGRELRRPLGHRAGRAAPGTRMRQRRAAARGAHRGALRRRARACAGCRRRTC